MLDDLDIRAKQNADSIMFIIDVNTAAHDQVIYVTIRLLKGKN